ncbi:MAG: TolC family protein [Thermodesulfobacteriota bacterium]
MKKYLIFLPFILSFFFHLEAGAEEWNLKICLDMGLKHNPALRAATKGIEGAEARIKQSQAAYYPYLFAETDYSHGESTSSKKTTYNVGSSDLTSYYVGLSQNIYDFGRREYKVQAAKEDLKAYQWTGRDTRLSVLDAIRQSYYGVLLAERVVKVRREDLQRTQEHLKQAQGFYQVGLKAKIDVTQAEVAVITAQKALLQAENNIQTAWVTLTAAMGIDFPRGITLKDDLDLQPVNWDLESLQKEALEKDPVLNRYRTLVSYWEIGEKQAQREFWPTLNGTARYAINDGTNYSNDESWNVGLQLNIPLFSGFLKKNKLAEIRAVLDQAKANLEMQRLSVINNLQNQYLNYRLAEKQIEVAKESLRRAKENLELAEGRYKAGVGNMLDVTDARSSFFQAETDYDQAVYSFITSRYKVERALGRE